MQDLAGKTAVVTGAASGMGQAFAHRFARAGMHVHVRYRGAPVDEAVAEVAEHGTTILGQVTDVADGAAVDELAEQAFELVDVLCNNAGVARAEVAPTSSTPERGNGCSA